MHNRRGRDVIQIVQLAEHNCFAVRRRQRGDRLAHARGRLGARQMLEWIAVHGWTVHAVERILVADVVKLLQYLAPRDSKEVGLHSAARRVESLQLPQKGEEDFLDDVFGQGRVTTPHMDCVAKHRRFVPLEKRGEGRFLPLPDALDEPEVIHLVSIALAGRISSRGSSGDWGLGIGDWGLGIGD